MYKIAREYDFNYWDAFCVLLHFNLKPLEAYYTLYKVAKVNYGVYKLYLLLYIFLRAA